MTKYLAILYTNYYSEIDNKHAVVSATRALAYEGAVLLAPEGARSPLRKAGRAVIEGRSDHGDYADFGNSKYHIQTIEITEHS